MIKRRQFIRRARPNAYTDKLNRIAKGEESKPAGKRRGGFPRRRGGGCGCGGK